jgi:hypothetical protein
MSEPAPALVWCSECKRRTQFVKISVAAREADVSLKTIYRYIEEGTVYAVKVAGKNYRLCLECLFRPELPA